MSNTVTKTITVGGSPSQMYAIWSNFAMFPQFMKYIEAVTITGTNRSHWVMNGPFGYKAEWDAETTRMDTDKRIAWRSIDTDDTNVKTSGQVTFNGLPDNQTEIAVSLMYVPPAGLAGEIVAEIFANPESRLEHDLENFKRFAENTEQRKAVTPKDASKMGSV